MPFPIEKKLVVGIASSALFDLDQSDQVFRQEGEEAYRAYQKERVDQPLPRGVAFPFIKRLLKLNEYFPQEQPVEVIFLSRNDPESGMRIFRSAKHYGLSITRGAFLTGKSPYPYIPAFNASLFLSAHQDDVLHAMQAGHPAGLVLPGQVADDADDPELRIAFDFDGVIADDEAEKVFSETGDLNHFHRSEAEKFEQPHSPGPLHDLLKKISRIQRLEAIRSLPTALRIAIISARNAPANERFVTTLKSWDIDVDETFFLGGIDKKRILDVLRPHIFFDDQLGHLEGSAATVPSVHIPFGIKNKRVAPATTPVADAPGSPSILEKI